MKKNKKGFTLIELLIVVAIIAILAAIAIPQFSAYRMRGYNAAANSDVRNLKTGEEALFADRQSYGVSENAKLVALTTIADSVPAAGLLGPMPPATDTVAGGAISTYIDTDANSTRDTTVGMGISISSNVLIAAGTAGTFGNYMIIGQHRLANRGFSSTSGGTAVCYVENNAWTILTNEAFPEATPPALMGVGCQAQAGGGSPVVNWVAL